MNEPPFTARVRRNQLPALTWLHLTETERKAVNRRADLFPPHTPVAQIRAVVPSILAAEAATADEAA